MPKSGPCSKELEACVALNKAAGGIIAAKEQKTVDATAVKKAEQSFKTVFDGEMMITGDAKVVVASEHFFNCAIAPKCQFLRDMAITMANACRTSLVGSVNAALPTLWPPTITGVQCDGHPCPATNVGGNMVQVQVK